VSVHDSRQLDGLLNRANTSREVFSDSAYRSAETHAKLRQQGFLSRIHTRAARNLLLSDAQCNANRRRSAVRVRIEHVFGAQETALGGRLVRVIGLVRAKAKIGLQDLAYNIQRMAFLERNAATT
jgi:transposase, IS5 family